MSDNSSQQYSDSGTPRDRLGIPYRSQDLSNNQQYRELEGMLVSNAMLLRQEILQKFIDPRRDLDDECGYPKGSLSPQFYQDLYDRDPIAQRVVQVFPRESWQVSPKVYEDPDGETSTPFEEALDALGKQLLGERSYFVPSSSNGSPLWEYLRRADEQSGIGQFGIILLGIKDGKRLDEPAFEPENPDGVGLGVMGTDMQYFRTSETSIDTQAGSEKGVSGRAAPARVTTTRGVRDYSNTGTEKRGKVRNASRNKAVGEIPEKDTPRGGSAGKASQEDVQRYGEGSSTGSREEYPNDQVDGETQDTTDDEDMTDEEGGDSTPLSSKKEVNPKTKLTFLRVFPESMVQITQYESALDNPRFGKPVMYLVTLNDPRQQNSGVGLPTTTVRVHWTRVIHIAEDLQASETFSTPRMQPVLPRILDLRKLYGGSAEMYWRGAFPGHSFESVPELGGDVKFDPAAMRNMYEEYTNGLQRAMFLAGFTMKSQAPQVVDPTAQINVQLEAICVKLGMPIRIFKGSERGELASSQDDAAWNDRLRFRQMQFITPHVIVPLLDRLITLGVLPAPQTGPDGKPDKKGKVVINRSCVVFNVKTGRAERFKSPPIEADLGTGYSIEWPDLDSLSDMDRATIASTNTQALTAYISGNAGTVVPPHEFLTSKKFLGLDDDEATQMLDKAEEEARAQEQQDQFLAAQQEGQGMVPGQEGQDGAGGGIGLDGQPLPTGAPGQPPPNVPPGSGPTPAQAAHGLLGNLPVPTQLAGRGRPPIPTGSQPPVQTGRMGPSSGFSPKKRSRVPLANVFCATGVGGGVDATCSPGERGGSSSTDGGVASSTAPPSVKERLATMFPKTAATVGSIKGAATAVGKAIWGKLPAPVQTSLAAVYHAGKAVEHGLESVYHAGQKAALAIAKERGYSEEQTAKLGKVLGIADGVARWTTNVPGVHHALHVLAHVGGPVGFLASKAGFYVPVASLAYVAQSTLRNPFATIRAARKAVQAAMGSRGKGERSGAIGDSSSIPVASMQESEAKSAPTLRGAERDSSRRGGGGSSKLGVRPLSRNQLARAQYLVANASSGLSGKDTYDMTHQIMTLNVSSTDQRKLADALEEHDFDDWYIALLYGALDENQGKVNESIESADAAYEMNPEPPRGAALGEEQEAETDSVDSGDEEPTDNIFCATGKGGGVDASCSPGHTGGSAGASNSVAESAKDAVASEPTSPPLVSRGKTYKPNVEADHNGDGVADYARVGVPAMSVPPPPPVGQLPNLTPRERAVEQKFIRAFHADPEGMASAFYREVTAGTKPGEPKTFGTDDAKVLSAAWTDGTLGQRSQNRATLNNALHQVANAVAKRAFVKELDSLKTGDEVMVTVGGCGAGKGYALKNVPKALEMKQRSKVVWDSAGDQNATENPWIQHEAEKRGLKVNYVFVHADPYSQWAHPERGVVKRAQDPNDGRMVDAKVFADSYAMGAKNHQAFYENNKDNPSARFVFLSNGKGGPKQLDGIPREALEVDRKELADYATSHIAISHAPAHVKRGALQGVRIWKQD